MQETVPALGIPPLGIPNDLFVGTMTGLATCTPDEELHQVWPKFMVIVLLQGAQHFVMDGEHFRLDAGDADISVPQLFMLNVARPCLVRFVNDSDVAMRKVMVSAPLPWVQDLMRSCPEDGMPALRRFFAGHLNRFSFEPGRALIQLAERILEPPAAMQGELRTLYRKSNALQLMCEACLHMLDTTDTEAPKPVEMNRRQIARIHDHILENLARPLTVEGIAREMGLSTSSIQRHFKEHLGMTVYEFIRLKRLEAARAALERDGVPIAQAAWIAGYTSPTSFTAAFKKTYGLPPKHHRA